MLGVHDPDFPGDRLELTSPAGVGFPLSRDFRNYERGPLPGEREGHLARTLSISYYLIVWRQIVHVNEMQATKAGRRTERATTRSTSEEIMNYPGNMCVCMCV